MKISNNIWSIGMILLGACILIISTEVQAQKKAKARISVDYIKIMGEGSSIDVAVKFKGENGYEPAMSLALNIYREWNEDSLTLAGEVVTNMNGKAQYQIDSKVFEASDSVVIYKYWVKIEKSKKFKKAKKSVKFQDVSLTAKSIVKDSMNYISAILKDAVGAPLEGKKLQVRVQRLFAPLTIGESSYKSNEEGEILVPLENPLPGIDGNLTFEVVLDARKYGTVSYVFDTTIGTTIVDISTYDKRTMWSPPNRTPLFLWIFPNLIILVIWFTMALMVINLYKIYKS